MYRNNLEAKWGIKSGEGGDEKVSIIYYHVIIIIVIFLRRVCWVVRTKMAVEDDRGTPTEESLFLFLFCFPCSTMEMDGTIINTGSFETLIWILIVQRGKEKNVV